MQSDETPPEKPADRLYLITLIILTSIGAALRLSFAFQPIMHDEAVNYMYFAAQPLSYGLSHYPYPNNHLLNTFLVHFVTRIAGNSPFAIRLPAFIAGVLLIPMTYLLIKALYNRKAGIVAAALIVPSSLLIAYSADGRGFEIQAFLFLLLVLIAARLREKESPKIYWASFAVVAALGFYTVPTMLYFFVPIVLWLAISAGIGDLQLRMKVYFLKLAAVCVATAGLVLMLYLPVFLTSGIGSVISNTWVKPLSLSAFFKGLWPGIRTYWGSWNTDRPLIIGIIVACGAITSIVFQRRMSKKRINLLLVLLITSILLMLLQRVIPPARVFLPMVPLYLGCAAAGLTFVASLLWARLARTRKVLLNSRLAFPAVAICIAVLLAVPVLVNNSPYQPQDQVRLRGAQSVASTLKRTLRSGDIVYIEANIRKPLEYYFLRENIPMKYIYMYPEDVRRQFKGIKRAFVIDGSSEGSIYGYQVALDRSNLESGKTYNLRLWAELPDAKIYIIDNPWVSG